MLRALCLACALSALASAAAAQTDVFPNLWVTDARVEGMAVLGDTLFASGRFRRVGPPTGQLAVLDKTTGVVSMDQPRFAALETGSPGITVVLPDGGGGYYAGGEFTAVEGQSRSNLAHVLSDGALDPDFRPDPTTAAGFGIVTSLALDGGVLYVGGQFDTVAGQPRQNLAALDAAIGVLLPLHATFGSLPFPNEFVPNIQGILAHAGVLYVAGNFVSAGGEPRDGIAAFQASTGALLPWRPVLSVGPPSPNPSAARLVLGDGTLYVDGAFETVGGQTRIGLAEVTLADPITGTGGTPTAWTPAQQIELSVRIGGFLWGPASGGGLGRLNRTNGAFQAFPVAGTTSLRSLAYDPTGGPSGQGVLYVGAQRPTNASGGDRYPVVVGVDPASGQPTGFDVSGASEDNVVTSLAVEPGPSGRLFVGGGFLTFGAGVASRQGLAAFSLATGRPTGFASAVTGPSQGLFEDLALAPDGRTLYGFSDTAGGVRLTEFDLATGGVREFIPRAQRPEPTAMTTPQRSSRPVPASNPRVENATSALVVTDDGAGSGRICVSSRGVACYDRASAALLFYTPLPSVTAQGENNGDLLYLPPGGPVAGPGGAEGTLYVAAPIEDAPAGTRRPAFVAVDYATGTVLPSWDVGFGPTGGPEGYTLALLDRDGADGPAPAMLYLGGDRQWMVQGQARQELMAVDPTTAALQPWAPRVSGGPVFSMTAQQTPGGGGVVYVGGAFRFVNGTLIATSMAAFDAATGAYFPEWNPVTYVTFVSLVSQRHSAVFLGGSFADALQGDGALGGGTGHVGVVGVSPARPLLPTAGEAGGPEAPLSASVALAGPNPLRSRTALAVSLPEAQTVEASLYDVLGRRVSVLHAGPLPAGISRLDVDASALPAGVYVARVTGAGFTEALTLTVVR